MESKVIQLARDLCDWYGYKWELLTWQKDRFINQAKEVIKMMEEK